MRVLSLDDGATREAATRDPAGFIANLDEPVLIDEVQRAPDLLLEIKRNVDRNPTPGRFLLTGSSNVFSSKKVSDALTGRTEIIRLWPLMQVEIENQGGNFIDALFEETPPDVRDAPVGRKAIQNRLIRGGYPEAFERDGRRRRTWYRNYVDTTIRNDLSSVGEPARIDEVPRLLRILAGQAASVLTYRNVAERLEINHETVKAYVDYLELIGIVVRLQGWRPGFAARETSKPKVYVADTGLLCSLIGADEERLLKDPQLTGRAVENFVAMEIMRHSNWSRHEVRLFHYHQRNRDIDLVIERSDGALVAIEVKSAATVGYRDYRWIEELRDRSGDRFVAGVVICTSDQRIPLGDRLWSLPLSGLWSAMN